MFGPALAPTAVAPTDVFSRQPYRGTHQRTYGTVRDTRARTAGVYRPASPRSWKHERERRYAPYVEYIRIYAAEVPVAGRLRSAPQVSEAASLQLNGNGSLPVDRGRARPLIRCAGQRRWAAASDGMDISELF